MVLEFVRVLLMVCVLFVIIEKSFFGNFVCLLRIVSVVVDSGVWFVGFNIIV